jgi:hypothetical protein
LPKVEELSDNNGSCLLMRRDTRVGGRPRAASSTCQSFAISSTVSVAIFGLSRGVELVELAPAVGPAAGQYHTIIAAVRSGKLVIGTISVNLKDTAIAI